MNATELQDRARRLVQQEVCYCVSSLIYAACQNFEHATALGFSEEDLFTLGSREPDADDYSDVAPASLQVAADGDSFKWKDGEGMWSPPFDSKLEAYRDAFEDLGLDRPDGSEIFEHWLVTDWFAGKLEEQGESVVRDALGLTVWGRATTGQAIYIDHVIEQIVRELYAPRYVIEPQRDANKGAEEGADGSTNFVPCDEAEAEIFAVFDTLGREKGDAELVEDFPTRAAAEAFISSREG